MRRTLILLCRTEIAYTNSLTFIVFFMQKVINWKRDEEEVCKGEVEKGAIVHYHAH